MESVSGDAVCADAQIAAKALSAWQQAGATSGDVRFWQPFVGKISSPKGYVLLYSGKDILYLIYMSLLNEMSTLLILLC